MIRTIRNLARARGGTAAVEFALILPIMVTLLFGAFEVTNGIVIYMKLIAAADTVTDLVAQTPLSTTLHSADIDNFYTAAQLVITPSSPAGLGLAVASVTFDPVTGTPSVAWQQTRGGAAAMTNAAAASVGLGNKGDSVIVATTTYTYTSLLRYVVRTPIVMSQRTFTRPRLVISVPYS